jgi:hypothetical protein
VEYINNQFPILFSTRRQRDKETRHLSPLHSCIVFLLIKLYVPPSRCRILALSPCFYNYIDPLRVVAFSHCLLASKTISTPFALSHSRIVSLLLELYLPPSHCRIVSPSLLLKLHLHPLLLVALSQGSLKEPENLKISSVM